MSQRTETGTDGPDLDGLLAELRRLDRRLRSAVAAMRVADPEADSDPYRGLYVTRADVEHLLGRPPGAPTPSPSGLSNPGAATSAGQDAPRLARLARECNLDPFDVDVVLLALAPELDLRYERVYGFLQDDVTRRRPTVDLALNLLCGSPADRLARRDRFTPAAPLVRSGLLHVVPDPAQIQPPLLSRYLTLDDEVVSWLLDGDDEPPPGPPAHPVGRDSVGHPEGDARSEAASGGPPLAALARQLALPYGWADLVLPPDQRGQLDEICARVRHRQQVYDAWGFGRKLAHGRGLHVLFAGPPGTGKTMAASVVANELNLALYRIDLAQVVSKYVGETEKNLERIFSAAEQTDAILFFDEADALFGKRSEVKDAHDRYANIEISYLLQRMEEYEGLAILATNLRQHLDEAFLRRLQVSVEFPFPDEAHRRLIWTTLFPAEAPLDPDVDLDLLARELRLAGGNLKNIALAAAFYAAADGGTIGLAHLSRAAWREHEKLGRSWEQASLQRPLEGPGEPDAMLVAARPPALTIRDAP
jgi:hypothetical protein